MNKMSVPIFSIKIVFLASVVVTGLSFLVNINQMRKSHPDGKTESMLQLIGVNGFVFTSLIGTAHMILDIQKYLEPQPSPQEYALKYAF